MTNWSTWSMSKKVGAVIGLIVIALVVVSFVLPVVKPFYSANDQIGGMTFIDSSADLGAATGSRGNGVIESLGLAVSRKATAPRTVGSKVIGAKEAIAQEGELTTKKIIRDGTLGLFVISPEEAIKQVDGLAKTFGGFVQTSQIYQVSNGVKAGSIIIRVPADKFNATIIEIKKLAKEVEREEVDSKDVTEQFIDLEARLRNLRAEEARYIEIMARAQTIQETLDVASRLSNVRERIEVLQGQLQYLSRQVDMSTIRVNLTSYDDVKVFGIRWQPLYQVKKSFREMLQGLTSYVDTMVALIVNLPLIILWVVTIGFIIWIVWKLLRWINRRFIKKNNVQ